MDLVLCESRISEDWQLPIPDLLDVDNLSSSLLHLAKLGKEIPEAALGRRVVGREDRHLVQRWVRILIGRILAPDDFVLLELQVEAVNASHMLSEA